MESVEKVIKRLKERGMKITPQRVMILKFLEGNRNHPTPEDIYSAALDKFSAISYATVYNTLDLLKKLGEVREVLVEKGRVHYDPFTNPHHHAVCEVCGRIFDVEMDLSVPSEVDGFKVNSVDVVLRGVCKDCRKRGSN